MLTNRHSSLSLSRPKTGHVSLEHRASSREFTRPEPRELQNLVLDLKKASNLASRASRSRELRTASLGVTARAIPGTPFPKSCSLKAESSVAKSLPCRGRLWHRIKITSWGMKKTFCVLRCVSSAGSETCPILFASSKLVTIRHGLDNEKSKRNRGGGGESILKRNRRKPGLQG